MSGESDAHDRPGVVPPDATTITRHLAAWLGHGVSDAQLDALDAYTRWLADEGRSAGGIGPAEVPRLFDRHIGDSLAYLVALPRRVSAIVDIGSGVGLPGIPLAIMQPHVAVTLVDRSGRRSDLARRAVRILGLDNVDVRQIDVEQPDVIQAGLWEADSVGAELADLCPHRSADGTPVVVFRASLPITRAYGVLTTALASGGIGLFGVSRAWATPGVPEPPTGMAAHLVRAAPPMLDSPFWLLRMQGTSG